MFSRNRISYGVLDNVLDPVHVMVILTSLIVIDHASKNLVTIGNDFFYRFE